MTELLEPLVVDLTFTATAGTEFGVFDEGGLSVPDKEKK